MTQAPKYASDKKSTIFNLSIWNFVKMITTWVGNIAWISVKLGWNCAFFNKWYFFWAVSFFSWQSLKFWITFLTSTLHAYHKSFPDWRKNEGNYFYTNLNKSQINSQSESYLPVWFTLHLKCKQKTLAHFERELSLLKYIRRINDWKLVEILPIHRKVKSVSHPVKILLVLIKHFQSLKNVHKWLSLGPLTKNG